MSTRSKRRTEDSHSYSSKRHRENSYHSSRDYNPSRSHSTRDEYRYRSSHSSNDRDEYSRSRSSHSSRSRDRKRSPSKYTQESREYQPAKKKQHIENSEIHDYEKKVKQELQLLLEPEETESEKRLKAQQRRQAILAKYQQQTQTEQNEPSLSDHVPSLPITPTAQGLDSTETSPLQKEAEDLSPTFDMFADDGVAPIPETFFQNSDLKNDDDGYYCPSTGDVLGDKYRVLSTYGKGMFSVVVCAEDLITKQICAIKMLRNNQMMKRTGKLEKQILEKIQSSTDSTKNGCIKFYGSFEDRDHLCLVFEPMHSDLRNVLDRFGKKIGISIQAVQIYSYKLFASLIYLKKCGILHGDIKPDNILVDESLAHCKLADFGSAKEIEMINSQNAPYLQSRWYRAPEVILGCKLEYGIDIWSIGTTLFELYTGDPLFKGHDNAEMLKVFQEVKGKIPNRMVKQGVLSNKYFDEQANFCYRVLDRSTGLMSEKLIVPMKVRDLKKELLDVTDKSTDTNKVLQLYDLIEKCIVLDPKKRITPEQALQHPFFQSKSN